MISFLFYIHCIFGIFLCLMWCNFPCSKRIFFFHSCTSSSWENLHISCNTPLLFGNIFLMSKLKIFLHIIGCFFSFFTWYPFLILVCMTIHYFLWGSTIVNELFSPFGNSSFHNTFFFLPDHFWSQQKLFFHTLCIYDRSSFPLKIFSSIFIHRKKSVR